MNDLRFAIRQLLKNPGFTAVAVLTLALGIGATTAIVSVVKTAVFDSLPAPHPERLLQFGASHVSPGLGWHPGISPFALRAVRGETNLFARVAAYSWENLTLEGEVFPKTVRGARVTQEFFGFWDLRPLLGRTFAEDEGQPAKNHVLVISHRLWQRQFGGDPDIIGRSVPFRERPMTVVGVMPPHFSFPEPEYDYWRPVAGPNEDEYLPNIRAIGEMRAGVEITQVRAFLDAVTQQQAAALKMEKPQFAFRARGLGEMFSTRELRRTLGLLLAAIVAVLLIASVNVANLQLARTEVRQQELAVRAALGAGHARVFRQLLTESLLLAVLGGLAAIAVAMVGLGLMERFLPSDLPRLKPMALNEGVMGIASGVTIVTGLLFGLAPAWIGRRSNLGAVLKLGALTTTRESGRARFSRLLIVGQVASVLVLLTGAGLMIRSVIGLLRVNPGLDARHVVRVYPSTLNKTSGAAFAFLEDSRQRVAAIPGVVATGVAAVDDEADVSMAPGLPEIPVMKFWIGVEEADPLRVLRVRLKRGRWLDRGDAVAGVNRVVINETAARRLWPGEEAVGKHFMREERTGEAAYEVVGVVGDTLDYTKQIEPPPTLYRAIVDEPGIRFAAKFVVVRTAPDPRLLYKPISQALKDAGSDLSMPEFIHLGEALRTRMAGHRTVMLGLTVFGGVGLALSAIGLYGVLAYSVARRTREIGIRMALGARISDVIRLILGQGLALVAVGGVIGLASAFATGRMLRAYLFGVSSIDPAAFVGAALLLGIVALIACWLPARHAANTDPMEALRQE